MKEFNLSEKIRKPYHCEISRVIHTDDVKEFIRLIKIEVKCYLPDNWNGIQDNLIEEIDKIAGDDLI